jgi:iron complex outermembrane receptor protein
VPDDSGSLWVEFNPRSGKLGGLSAAAGVRRLGSSIDYANEIRVPAVTLVDAMLGYDFAGAWERLRIALNASNLFDKTHVSSCEGIYWCMYGPRRVVTASLIYRNQP